MTILKPVLDTRIPGFFFLSLKTKESGQQIDGRDVMRVEAVCVEMSRLAGPVVSDKLLSSILSSVNI